jgi:hypothetical protein
MSALPPKADIVRHGGNVRFVPEADIIRLIRSLHRRDRSRCRLLPQCVAVTKSCITRERATRALRVIGGVLRLRPTKRGTPFVAPIAATSPCLIAAFACRRPVHQ